MAELFDVHEATGALIGGIPISPQDLATLHRGETVTIQFHTPKMLREELGAHNGVFEIMELDGKLLVTNPDAVKEYIELQEAIGKLKNAQSDRPVR